MAELPPSALLLAGARKGSILRACERLLVTQPTVSMQIRTLKKSLGEKLFSRVGRNPVLTDAGRIVCRYADEIFTLGQQIPEGLHRQAPERGLRLVVGVTDVLSKLIAYRFLDPALRMPDRIHVVCREGKADSLLAELAILRLDLLLSDSPVTPTIRVKAFNHLFGDGSPVQLIAESVQVFAGPIALQIPTPKARWEQELSTSVDTAAACGQRGRLTPRVSRDNPPRYVAGPCVLRKQPRAWLTVLLALPNRPFPAPTAQVARWSQAPHKPAPLSTSGVRLAIGSQSCPQSLHAMTDASRYSSQSKTLESVVARSMQPRPEHTSSTETIPAQWSPSFYLPPVFRLAYPTGSPAVASWR